MAEPVTLCVLVHAVPGRRSEAIAYEDRVLALLDRHGARLVERLRSRGGGPLEIHVLRFASEDALAAFQADPDRAAAAALRERAIARSEVLRAERVA
jgi:uncharacterized protein (DUF1330 family)